jgi:copper(I)-binding protein
MKAKLMSKATSLLVAAALLLGAAAAICPAVAHSYKLGDVAVGHIWAKAPEAGADGVSVYAPILNSGKVPLRLVGAASPIGDEVRLRKVAKDGTVTWPQAIEVSPGKPFTLAAWREHLWVSGLREPLKDGDWFELTLDFGDKGKLPVKVRVETAPGH